jgi:hypothetical protein
MGSCCQGDAPTPPNPTATAAAQTGTNVSTAVANNMLNNMNQQTPGGSLDYSNTGSFSWTDPSTNQTYNIPLRTVTQSLSPSNQNIYNLNQQSQTNLAGLAANQSGVLQSLLGTPYDPNRGQFNAYNYLQQNPDVAAAAKSAGSYSTTFDPQAYLNAYGDVAAAAQNATTAGTPGTRSTTFDAQAYLAAYPDVAQVIANMGLDPATGALQHYQQFGQAEGRDAGFPIVGGTAGGTVDPLAFAQQHYNEFGKAEGRQGGFAFTPADPAAYAAEHYRNTGMMEGRASGGQIAPRAGDPNSLSGFSLQDSYGNPNDKQLRDFDGGGAITRDYGPADGFSADRLRVENAMYERMAPQLERDRQRMEAQLRDQGNLAGGEAYGAQKELFNKQLTDTRLGITAQGGQEQKLLNDMAAQRAGFQNAAQKQAFEQSQGRATFANAAQQQDFTQAGLRAQFANTAQGQRMAMAQAKLDAENNARKQFLSEQYAQRQAPINEISALMSGSQVQQPTWANTASSQIPTTDYAGLVNNRFSQDMANYQQSSQNFNQIMGGIFGAVAGLTMSDRREKNVGPKLGTVFAAGPDGERKLPIHEYKYKDDPAAISHVGPMAQDVEKVDRGAVKTIAGTKYIDMTRMGSILRDKKEARHGR